MYRLKYPYKIDEFRTLERNGRYYIIFDSRKIPVHVYELIDEYNRPGQYFDSLAKVDEYLRREGLSLPNDGKKQKSSPRVLKSYEQCWRDVTWLTQSEEQFDNHIDGKDYDPKLHWRWHSTVPSGTDANGDVSYRRGYLADVSFFKNKCQEMMEDVDTTSVWYRERYAHIEKRFIRFFEKALEKEIAAATKRINSSKKLIAKAEFAKYLKEDTELE
jgi:hypothetical protein